ncbi:uncharacterized protein A1O5_00507 [Cladophialophora psammophila CBS 110553]|uniref:NAD-dependent epimerase/dehydratase domain-containing protein n=1 Tax=Cladophialophora psammophila CBS 110553 TaxID=1182543 RepID=W9Y0I8_9EURO|nr:uncharacterized protein A1O5_00507 [Cladophialophora psammophila CBS 110553]EXJ75999.1 hypothetical protein A1O5_00507 [Cladophialophora psammophila CBS 110553]
MPRVLVFGATGYLGQAVTQALVRSGLHTVYGLCRSASRAQSLATSEIIPVMCEDPVNAPDPYLRAVRSFRIDAVVDCTAAYGDSAKFLADVKTVGQERLETFRAEGVAVPPKISYIYISGAWVHGHSDVPVTDLDPVGAKSAPTQPLPLVAWRPELERKVLAARDVLDVLIFRPAQMHGRSSSGWTALWGPIAQAVADGKSHLQVPVAPTSQSPVIHVDDVASAVCRGVGKVSLLGGTSVYPVFDLVSTTENIRDILSAFARALSSTKGQSGKLELELVGPGDHPVLQAPGATVQYDSARARELLGWEPNRNGLVKEMGIFAKAWEANQ